MPIPRDQTRIVIYNNELGVYLDFIDPIGITLQRPPGHVMKRGTLMVLKRLLVTALGALGLGALATGPVFAQTQPDQIPGPRLYGDISSCAGGMLPEASTERGTASLLGMGGLLDQAFDSSTAPGIQMDYTQNAALILTDALVTSIGGGVTNEIDDLLELLSVADCNNPVATNVSEAVDLYGSYVSAKETFEDLEEPDAEDTATYNTARMNKENFGGEVYNSVYDQQAKLAAARKAINDYNALVGGTGTLATLKQGQSDNAGTGYDGIAVTVTGRVEDWNANPVDDDNVALSGDDLHNNLNAQVAPVYGSGNTAGFRAIDGRDTAAAPVTVTNSILDGITGDEFDDAGALQFDMGNRNTNAFSRAATNIDTLGEIVAELDVWQAAVDRTEMELKAARDAGNLNTALQEERVRRATLGRNHVQGELDRLTRVVRSQNLTLTVDTGTPSNNTTVTIGTGDNAVTYSSERDLVDAYLRSRGNVVSAANKVRTAVSSLDNANRAVQARLKDPDNYLSQLVTLREYQQTVAENELEDAGGDDALQSFKDAVTAARNAVTSAKAQQTAHQNLTSEPGSTTSKLLNALLASEDPETDAFEDDDGQALLNAISDVDSKVSTLQGQLTDDDGNPIDLSDLGNTDAVTENTDAIAALTAMDDPETMEDETGAVTKNANDIMDLDERVVTNENNIGQIQTDLYGETSSQHDDLAACDATGLLNVANCANARSLHNEEDIEGINDKLMQKKEYIDNLAAEIGVNPVTGEGTGEGGMSRIDMNEKAIADETQARMDADTALGERIDGEAKARADADTALGERIDGEAKARADADTALGERIDGEAMARADADTALGMRIDGEAMARADADTALGMRIDGEAMARADADLMLGGMIMDEEMARMEADTMLGGMIMDEEMARMEADTMLGGMISAEEMARMEADTALGGRISSNADAIASNMNSIGQNASAISDNRNMIGELSDDLDVVRAGVAASMALAGMPAINGRGISIGVGSYDGESAFAVGFQIQGEQASFKVGVTSSGGETGASAGVGFNF
ncbi:MAG: YadA C-terminal domain-containing protein [Rhodospirillaceae bacterium]|nr:YadA C-terminal domain-containing protein [Rhodospirillaceae bacterium]